MSANSTTPASGRKSSKARALAQGQGRRKRAHPALLVLLCWPLAARAASQSQTGFLFDGHTIRLPARPVTSGYNPSATSMLNDPGAHVVFFGHASPCPGDGQNGPAGPLTPAQRAALAARDPEFPPIGKSWSPLPGGPACATTGAPGPAFVSIGGGTLRLHTRAGAPGHGFAFGPFTRAGQTGTGVNAGIVGSFVSWTLDWHSPTALAPFTGPRHTLVLATDQAVPIASAAPARQGVNQVKQQVAINVTNIACRQAHGKLCEICLMVDIGVIRAPGTDWSKLAGNVHANLMFDAAENQLPVIEAPLLAAGTTTMLPGAGPLWQSTGAATPHHPFANRHFAATLTFANFLNAVRAAASRAGISPPASALLPAHWRINLINVAQEDHNVSGSMIAGKVSDLSVTAE